MDERRSNRLGVVRLFLDLLGIVGILLWLPSFLPNLHVDHRSSSDPKDPFSAPFSATNNGLTSIWDVRFGCNLNNESSVTAEGSPMSTMSAGFNWFHQLAPEIDRGDTFDFTCPFNGLLIPKATLVHADIDVVISFVPRFVHWRLSKCVRFIAVPTEQGHLEWFQRPDDDRMRCFIEEPSAHRRPIAGFLMIH
jgi:hypothetical protein